LNAARAADTEFIVVFRLGLFCKLPAALLADRPVRPAVRARIEFAALLRLGLFCISTCALPPANAGRTAMRGDPKARAAKLACAHFAMTSFRKAFAAPACGAPWRLAGGT
jgi:hypothetical protein